MNYSLRVLITDESTLTLVLLADALKIVFAKSPLIEVELVPGNVRSWDENPAVVVHDHEMEEDWTLTISESEEMGLDEREVILENVSDHPDYQKIAACKRRFYVSSDKDDDLDYLDVFARVEETFGEFPGVYVFDEDLKQYGSERT